MLHAQGFLIAAQKSEHSDMALNLKAYKAQAEREARGVWRDYAGARLLVAHISSPEYDRVRNKLAREHRQALLKGGPEAEKLTIKLLQTAASETLLLGWENIQDESGANVPYSTAQALKFFQEIPKFFRDVVELANENDRYENEQVEQDSKNLLAASSGS